MKRQLSILIQRTLTRSSGLIGDCLATFLANYETDSTHCQDFASCSDYIGVSPSTESARLALLDASHARVKQRFELLCKYFEASLHEQLHGLANESNPKLHRNWVQIENERNSLPYANLQRLERRIVKVCQGEWQELQERFNALTSREETLPLSPRIFAVALKDCLQHGLVFKDQSVFVFHAVQLDFVFRLRMEIESLACSLPALPDLIHGKYQLPKVEQTLNYANLKEPMKC